MNHVESVLDEAVGVLCDEIVRRGFPKNLGSKAGGQRKRPLTYEESLLRHRAGAVHLLKLEPRKTRSKSNNKKPKEMAAG